MRVTVVAPNVYTEFGISAPIGSTITVGDDYGASLVWSLKAIDTDGVLSEPGNRPFDQVPPQSPVSGGRGVYVFDTVPVSGAANTTEQILKQYLLPAGLLLSTNYIRMALLVGKSGVSENMTLRIRLGLTGTTSDAQLTSTTAPSSSTRSNASEFHFFAASPTQIRHLGASPFGGMLGGNAAIVPPVNITIPDMSAAAMYLSVSAQMASGVETPTVHHVVLCRE